MLRSLRFSVRWYEKERWSSDRNQFFSQSSFHFLVVFISARARSHSRPFCLRRSSTMGMTRAGFLKSSRITSSHESP